MLFNSWLFAIFFVIVYILYLAFSHRWQNRMLLAASCVFYGAWDWRFLFLMFISITTDFVCSRKIFESNDEAARRRFLVLSIIVNLSILGFFKYFNFFAANLEQLLSYFGIHVAPRLLHIVLPVGISFYTFQSMSYTLDVYRRHMEPTKSYLDYALFVTFFPQLVAGPIMRAADLLPQVIRSRRLRLDWIREGSYLILWGLFQKMFVADNLAKIVDSLFASKAPYNGMQVLTAIYAFAFQIYCDFAGYSNIARGLGRLMGFDIMVNFNLPYFATNPREFWKRWHISLSTWLKDYLYISLGGNRLSRGKTYRNLAITMLLGGLWHGAAWTYVIWGAYHGLLLIIHRMLEPFLRSVPSPKGALAGKAWFYLRAFFFFHLVCLGWLFFRATGVAQIAEMLKALFFDFTFHTTAAFPMGQNIYWMISCLWLLLAVQFIQYRRNDLMAFAGFGPFFRTLFIYACVYYIVVFTSQAGKAFIYFQF